MSTYSEQIDSETRQEFNEYLGYRVVLLPPRQPFSSINDQGQVVYKLHMGQRKVMQSKKRIIAAIAGRQGGKSAIGAPWLHEEMRAKGPGLYMVVAPSFPLLSDSAIPKIEELFTNYYKYGQIRSNPLRFVSTADGERRLFRGTPFAGVRPPNPTTIRFGHAANPESLEAKTALAAWLDEAGQDGFKLASWEAIQGRLTTTLGRVLITTTPYNLGWLKTRVVDPWQEYQDGIRDKDPDIDVIAWKSIGNPAFSIEEYERLRNSMPMWKWNMFYNGVFGVPAGLIYGILKELEAELKIPRSAIPVDAVNYLGLDFGGPNTCGVIGKRDVESGAIYISGDYFPGKTLPTRVHVENLMRGYGYFERAAGGAHGEVNPREEFIDNGLMVEQPSISDVQTGIDRVYGLIAQRKLFIAEDLEQWWDEVYTYQYETDPDSGDVLDELKIKNKSRYHRMDATRYLCSMFGTAPINFARGGGERVAVAAFRNRQIEQMGLKEATTPFNPLNLPENTATRIARGGAGNNPVLNRQRRNIGMQRRRIDFKGQ